MKKNRQGATGPRITSLKLVDFFCGAGGMSYGLHKAGFEVLAGIDNDGDCRKTYEANVPGAQFIKQDVTRLTAHKLAKRLNIKRDDPSLVFAGCSPCQYWSKIRTDKTNSHKTAFLLKNFQRFIRQLRPGFIIVENVPGLLSNKEQSILPDFLKFLTRQGYSFDDGIINASRFGVPQNRTRYLLVATRLTNAITLPKPAKGQVPTVRDFLGVANGFKAIAAGHRDESSFQHTAAALSENNIKRIRLTPRSGGNRSCWKDMVDLQIPAYKDKDDIFTDVYARMYWDRAAPTITTRFLSFSNGRFGHPSEHRAISIREGATLQTFPKKFVFHGSTQTSIARQIGNAVPPELARRIGRHLMKLASSGKV
jgi:DNA (cytosine-5)-methyltransferase 1